MKAAIIILSDPKSGSEEALGRVFNALAAAYDFKNKGDEVTVLFHGAGTRWPSELSKADHPAHGLYEAVSDTSRESRAAAPTCSVRRPTPRAQAWSSSRRTESPAPADCRVCRGW